MSSRWEHLWYYIAFSTILLCMEILRQYVLIHFDYNFEIHLAYTFLFHFLVTAIVANTVSFIFHEIRIRFATHHLMMKKVLPLMRFLSLVIVWIIGLIYFSRSLSLNIDGFLTGAGIGGALFLLGAKDVFANFLGTLSIVMSHMFEIGDHVSSGSGTGMVEGVVEEITLNYTKITNMEGKVVYIPNSTLLSQKFENITRRRYYLHTWTIPIDRGMSGKKITSLIHLLEKKVAEFSPRSLKIEQKEVTTSDYIYIIKAEFDEENTGITQEIEEYILEKVVVKGEGNS